MTVKLKSLQRLLAAGLTPFLVHSSIGDRSIHLNIEESAPERDTCFVEQVPIKVESDGSMKELSTVSDLKDCWKTQLLANGYVESTLLEDIGSLTLDLRENEDLTWLNECSGLRTLKLNLQNALAASRLGDFCGLASLTHVSVSCVSKTTFKDAKKWQEEQFKYTNGNFVRLSKSGYDPDQKNYYNHFINDTILEESMFDFLRNCPNIESLYVDGFLYTEKTDISWINYCKSLKRLYINAYYDGYWSLEEKISAAIDGLDLSNLKIRVNSKLLNDENEAFISSFLSKLPIEEIEFRGSLPNSFAYAVSNGKKTLYVGEGDKIDFYNLDGVDTLDYSHSGLYYAGIYLTSELIEYLKARNIEIELGPDHTLEELEDLSRKLDETYASLNVKGQGERQKLIKILDYIFKTYTYADLAAVDDIKEKFYKDGVLYGATHGTKIVCGNYSSLLCSLLQRTGIESYYIRSPKHAWNLIEIDGCYYHVDATFLDSEYDRSIAKGEKEDSVLSKVQATSDFLGDPLSATTDRSSQKEIESYQDAVAPYWLDCFALEKDTAVLDSKLLSLKPKN